MRSQRCPISIICVFNDARVLQQCLESSIERHRSEVHDLDCVKNLEAAYAQFARTYPNALPVRTPNRKITRRAAFPRRRGLIPQHFWRVRWLRESIAAYVGRGALKGARCVLGDIRWCIDDVLAEGAAPLLIVDVDRDGTFFDDQPDPLVLKRREYEFSVTSGAPETAVGLIRSAAQYANVLVCGLSARDLRSYALHLWNRRALLGFREVGYWLLVGPSAAQAATRLRSQRSIPFGMGWGAT